MFCNIEAWLCCLLSNLHPPVITYRLYIQGRYGFVKRAVKLIHCLSYSILAFLCELSFVLLYYVSVCHVQNWHCNASVNNYARTSRKYAMTFKTRWILSLVSSRTIRTISTVKAIRVVLINAVFAVFASMANHFSRFWVENWNTTNTI